MEIIDTHMHLWTPATHPWLLEVRDGGHPAGKFEPVVNYLVEDYRRDMAGFNVAGCVHVEAVWPGDPLGETQWLNELAESTGTPTAMAGYCDLSSPGAEETLRRQAENPRVRSIRQMLNHHPEHPQYSAVSHDNYLTDPAWLAGYTLLEKYNLSFEMHIMGHQLARAAGVVRAHPGVQVMLNHCGVPYLRDDRSMAEWRQGLRELAQCPNVFVKASGMFATDPSWDQQSVEDVVKPILEIFGIDRCVFASNFPVDRINGTMEQLMGALEPILAPYSQADREKFFSGNAKKFYRL